jgi:hypothetical protein
MKSGIRRRGDRQTTGYLSLGFLVASNLVLLLYGLCHLESGLYSFMALASASVFFPRSF